jgi:predicted acylesterase/phospholipase RssA
VSDDAPGREARCPTPPTRTPPVQKLVGLALSGGGIRSASFNLGILQGLQSRDALWLFDYLSTVSGGGFIGAWWSAWQSREKRPPGDIFPAPEELEPQRRQETAVLFDVTGARSAVPSLPDGSLIARRHDPIHFVRLFSNYLTPKTGAFSPDTWRLIAFYVRSLLFTWAALLPLLLAAVIGAQAFFLANKDVARAFLCPLSPAAAAAGSAEATLAATAQPAATAGRSSALFCDSFEATSGADSSVAIRLRHLGRPLLLLFAAYATFALLWLAHSSARIGLALIAFVVLGFLGGVMIAPIFMSQGSSRFGTLEWCMVAVVIACITIHVVQSFRNRERFLDGTGGTGTPVLATPADHRVWLTQQQAILLKVGTFAGVLLLVAGFGHDVLWLLFSGGDSVLGRLLRRAGGWAALLLTVASAAYTVIRAAPSAKTALPPPPNAFGRLLIAIAPWLVLLLLSFSFALFSRWLLVHTMEVPSSIVLLANAVVWLAVVEVIFAVFESYHDPIIPLDEGSFSWRRFVPEFLLRAVGQEPAHRTMEKRPWYYLFSPRGWVRIAALAGFAIVIGFAEHRSVSSFWSAVASPSTTTIAAIVLGIALVVTFVPRQWKVALDSARPAGLLVIASATALLCLLCNGGIATSLHGGIIFAALLWIALLVGWVIGIGWLADPNLLSMHAFYKARLTRAYLGASNTARENEEITDAAPGDDLQLTSVWNHDAGGPYHLVNTTLSLVGNSDLAMSQRSAENFVMSRYHCGSARAGYRCTADYMAGQLSLGTAAAISGAAVSPTMGSKSPGAALALLLSLFNVRLGFWAPTPSGRRWNEPHARLWPFYLLRETLSNTGQIGTYCYLTDGGHFDNTGLYALVERGCRYIVVCDCGADPRLGFDDIGVAIRRCRIDFGTEIDLRIDDFVARARATETARTHVVRGTIRYQADHLRMLRLDADEAAQRGVILWIKPSVTALNAVDVRQYHRAHSDFPQQSTADQWYDESQFESYRRLGYESARKVFDDAAGTPANALREGEFARVDDWFLALQA